MDAKDRCPACNAELAANAPRGLCPACLLKGGLGTQTGGTGGSNPSQQADFVPPTPAELAPHFPDLEILELLGRGGMGVVYKARQKRLDRLVALKILLPKNRQGPAFAERFAREARAMAMLSHPHIVAVYDFGQTPAVGQVTDLPHEGGLYYFLMEFIDGMNLRRLLDTGKVAPEEALAIVPQICDALQYAHDYGVVHRDIKPENILLNKRGQVKIADFGIAKLVGHNAKDQMLTDTGQIVGTPQYMAPEQIEHPLEVDHRADIYSLGVVFYQMLTGELPIGRFAPPSRKVQVDVRLDEVVLRALEKEPERRYQHASEIKARVETIVTSPMPAGGGEPEARQDELLRVSSCRISTPKHVYSFLGRYFHPYTGKGTLRLDADKLVFMQQTHSVSIPLHTIRDLSVGHYSLTAIPARVDYIAITFEEGGTSHTLLFTPTEGTFTPLRRTNYLVADWFAATRDAVIAATGLAPHFTSREELSGPVPKGWKVLLHPGIYCGALFWAGVIFRGVGFGSPFRPFGFRCRRSLANGHNVGGMPSGRVSGPTHLPWYYASLRRTYASQTAWNAGIVQGQCGDSHGHNRLGHKDTARVVCHRRHAPRQAGHQLAWCCVSLACDGWGP